MELSQDLDAHDRLDIEKTSEEKKTINVFQKYLSIWIVLAMVIGVLLGHYIPILALGLGSATVASVSIPISVLLCTISS